MCVCEVSCIKKFYWGFCLPDFSLGFVCQSGQNMIDECITSNSFDTGVIKHTHTHTKNWLICSVELISCS